MNKFSLFLAIGDQVLEGPNPSFKASHSHNGKNCSCKDKSHPNLKGGKSPFALKSQEITVYCMCYSIHICT